MELHSASSVGDVPLVKALLAQGAAVNAKGPMGNWTALHAASGRGHVSVVEALIDAQADLQARDHDRRTPLDWAQCAGFHDIAAKLRRFADGDQTGSLKASALRALEATTASTGLQRTLSMSPTSQSDTQNLGNQQQPRADTSGCGLSQTAQELLALETETQSHPDSASPKHPDAALGLGSDGIDVSFSQRDARLPLRLFMESPRSNSARRAHDQDSKANPKFETEETVQQQGISADQFAADVETDGMIRGLRLDIQELRRSQQNLEQGLKIWMDRELDILSNLEKQQLKPMADGAHAGFCDDLCARVEEWQRKVVPRYRHRSHRLVVTLQANSINVNVNTDLPVAS